MTCLLPPLEDAWGILPSALEVMKTSHAQFIDRIKAGTFDDLFEEEPNPGEMHGVHMVDGVAVVDVIGVLMKRDNFWIRWFGGVSMDRLKQTIERLADSGLVKAIVLDVDSPGGTVVGTRDLGEAIFQAREKKPITAVVNELAASCACWISSAATRVVIGETATSGSIGVISEHWDLTAAAAEAGAKPTLFTTGRFKAASHQFKPIDDDARTLFQSRSDEYYRLFVEAIALYRDFPVEEVLEKMADARLFIGRQAVDVGLADEVGTLDEVISELAATATTTISGARHERSQEQGRYARVIVERN